MPHRVLCTGKCPGLSKMDIWDFINRVWVELPVEYVFIHPQLCEEDQVVNIYHPVPDAEQSDYGTALLAAYRAHLQSRQA